MDLDTANRISPWCEGVCENALLPFSQRAMTAFAELEHADSLAFAEA